MKRTNFAAVCVGTLLISTAAMAQDSSGFYFNFHGGTSFAPERDLTATGSIAGLASRENVLSFDHGLTGGVAFGMSLSDMFRGEFDISMSTGPVSSLLEGGSSFLRESASPDDTINTIVVMANVWADFDVAGDYVGYAGGGLGYGLISASIADTDATTGSSSTLPIDDSQGAFFGQIGFGVGRALANGHVISLDFRHMISDEVTFSSGQHSGTAASGSFDYQHSASSISLSYRIPL